MLLEIVLAKYLKVPFKDSDGIIGVRLPLTGNLAMRFKVPSCPEPT
jgi:hypothetical protein